MLADGADLASAAQLRLCAPTDDDGMTNSLFKFKEMAEDEEEEQSEAKIGSYYCLVSAIRGRQDQVRCL